MNKGVPDNSGEIAYIVFGICVLVVALLMVSLVQMKRGNLKAGEWIEHPI
ncbi:MAG: hypothetical protein JXQ30_13125 [Spirochaetes bacterium]|nr:hypothetical protein [Spirochaetota bacterium]